MLMPRAHQYNATTTTTTNNNNCKANMNISVSMRHQHHHVNQLLTTAAAGTGVVGDVDALLMPLQVTAPKVEGAAATQRFESRPERNLWRTDEIIRMLNIMQTTNAIELLNDKTVKSEKVFRNVEEIMHQYGYRKKSHVQIWTKWKFLKSTYTTSKRNGVMPKMIPLEIFEILHKILEGGTSDCGNSTASLDGNDSSNGAGGGHLVISGVEGGFNSAKKSNKITADSEEENGFGMAHPIFGFRLGMVKQEPVDTGYENLANHNGNVNGHKQASDNDDPDDDHMANPSGSTAAEIHFQTEIKQEIEEEICDSPQMPTPPSPPPPPPPPTVEKLRRINRSEIMINKRPVRITALPIATSTPTATTQASPGTSRNLTQLPPLRIAPFAKVPNNTSNAMQPLDRPPPPLSMHISPRPVRLTSTQNKPIFIQPKPLSIQPPPVRLSKEITVQTRSANNTLRLKQEPMRKAHYSLRPERIIPKLDKSPPLPDSFAPPHQYSVYQEGPCTSQQAQTMAIKRRMPPLTQTKKKNRRLEVPWNETNNRPNTLPMSKIPRIYSNASISPVGYNNGHENDDDDEADEDSSMFDNSASMQRESFKAAQEGQQRPFKPSRKEQEYFDSALKDLGTSLRQMQRELVRDFFEKQMELAQQEHEFQMRQDALIMEAFEEQSRKIMRTAKELLGFDLENPSPMKDGKEKIVKKTEEKNASHEAEKEAEERKILEAKDLINAAALEAMTEDHNEDEDDSDEEDEDENECDGEGEGEGDDACQMEEDEDDDEQLEYEDDDYLQDHSNEVECIPGETADNENDDDNDESSSSSEEEEEDEEDDDENENERDNDDVDDPIQMVSSELVEDN